MKKNIAFISLKSKFCKKLCKIFCDSIEMLYADINDVLQYNMVNQDMLQKAGKQYFETEEQKVLKSVCDCENIGINIDYNLVSKNNNIDIIKNNCLVIYLKHTIDLLTSFNKSTSTQHTKLLVAIEEQDKICSSFCDLSVILTGDDKNDCNNIIKQIKKYYNM